MVVNRDAGALRVLLQFVRVQDAGDQYAFRFEPQDYILPTAGGDSPSARFDWTKEVLADLQAVRLPGRDPAVVQRMGERLRRFVKDAGWAKHEQEIAQACSEHRPIFLTIRSSAAELYALPWELLTLKSGQFIGELDGLLLRFEWPESKSAQEQPKPRLEGGRILVAWSGNVPATEHIGAIAGACAAAFHPFNTSTDIVAHASIDRIVDTLAEAQQSGPPIAVLHLLCHGATAGSTFGLALDGERGSVVVNAAQLRQHLAPFAKMVRLVVLSACDSGNLGALGNQLGSIAQTLHRCGFQSVIASRFPLSVAGSIALTESFYGTLLHGPASIETAILAARKHLARREANLSHQHLDWASVQLYACHEDGDDTRPIVFRPFRGLEAFQPKHSRFFFGRDAELQEVLSDLEALRTNRKPQLLVVAGASGTGKSSLVLAGAVPALLKADPHLVFRSIRPGRDPIPNLQEALSAFSGKPGILVVDQFEEIFTQTADPAVREAFVGKLWRLASDTQLDLRILITLRIDFLGRCGELVLDRESGLRFDRVAVDPEHEVQVPQMNKAQLRAAIVQPARQAGLVLEAGLADRLLEDVGGEPGALPLLEDALEVLWQHRDGGRLTQAAYNQLGGESGDSKYDKGDKKSGVVGALRKRADDILAKLSPKDLELGQRLLVSLVAVADDTALDTRLRVSLDELKSTCTFSSDESDGFDRVLRQLVAARLLVQDDDEAHPRVEVAHEALIRNWPQLRAWLDEDRASLLAQRRILLDAQQWEEKQRDESRLYRGTALAQARQWQRTWESRRRRPSELTQRFLQCGEALEAQALHKQREAEESLAAERQQKVEAAQRLTQRTRIAAAVLGMLLLIAIAAGAVAAKKADDAKQSEAKALQAGEISHRQLLESYIDRGHQLLFTQNKPDDALLWFHRAYKEGSANPALPYLLKRALVPLEARRAVLIGHEHWVYTATFSPDGRRIVTASRDQTARVWDAQSGRQITELKGHTAWVYSAMYSRDGRRIVTNSEDTARVFDADNGRLLIVLKDQTQNVHSATFSPDGRRIVGTSEGHTMRVFDTDSGRPLALLKGHSEEVNSVAFSPDGRRIVTGSHDKTARVFDADSGRAITVLNGHAEAVNSVGFSPDGRRIVTTSDDLTARVFDADSGRVITVLKEETPSIQSASFSPDGRHIATAHSDNTAMIFDAETGQSSVEFEGHSSGVKSATYSPDGQSIVTTSGDSVVRVFDANSGGEPFAVFTDHERDVTSAVYSPDGHSIVTASEDGTARVFDIYKGRSLAELEGHTGIVHGATFSPDSRRIVTASADHTARVFEADSGRQLARLKVQIDEVKRATYSANGRRIVATSDHGNTELFDAERGLSIAVLKGHSATFSSDGRHIVTIGENHKAQAWDAENGHPQTVVEGGAGSGYSAPFSPDGRRILVDGEDYTELIFDAQSGHRLTELKGHINSINTAMFSRDGRCILTSSDDASACVWDAASGRQLALLRGHERGVSSATYGPDGRRIVTSSEDQTARVWDAQSWRPLVQLKGHTNVVWDAAFSPDGRRIVTASKDETARVWDADSGLVLAVFKGHTGSLKHATFSPDGRRIVTVSDDQTARVWDASPETRKPEQIAQLILCRGHARFEPEDSNVVIRFDLNPAACQAPPVQSQ